MERKNVERKHDVHMDKPGVATGVFCKVSMVRTDVGVQVLESKPTEHTHTISMTLQLLLLPSSTVGFQMIL